MVIKDCFWDNFSNQSNLVGAHRGFRAIRPENTISAFVQSLEKADFIELDVSFTKDGIAIIIHDDTLERTSDVKNHKEFKPPYNVQDYTYNEIKKLDFSSWFISTDPFDTIKNKIVNIEEVQKIEVQKILTLKEVLIMLKKNNFPINIEIKDMKNTNFDKLVSEIVVDIIKEIKMEKLVLLSSFNHTYMKELAKLAPNITRAALVEDKHPDNIVEYLKSLNVQGYHCSLEIIDKKIFQLLDKNGFFINVYTVNKQEDKKTVFDLGAKAIFTDFL